MLGPAPTMPPRPGRSKPTRIDPDDPFRIAAQGVREPVQVAPTMPPIPPAAPEPDPTPPTPPPPVTADSLPKPRKPSRNTVITLPRPDEPAIAGAAIVMPPTGPARAILLREGRTRIGRRGDVEIALDDPKASSDHALVRVEAGVAWLLDTSANGTVVSGVPCVNDRIDLRDGAVLKVGDTIIVLKLLGEDALAHLANC